VRQVLKWSLRSIAVIVVLVVLLALSMAIILNTESGTRWALARIDAALAGELSLSDVTGTFWQGLEFSSLQYRDRNRDIEAETVAVRVDWSGVATGQLSLRELRAATLQVRSRSEAAPEETGLTLSMTPLRIGIAVTDGQIGAFTFAGRGEPRRIEDISISAATLRGSSIRARAIAGSTSGIKITAQKVRLTLADEVPAAAEVAWTLVDGNWSGQGRLQGSLTRLNFEQSVSGAYPFSAQGTVQILHQTEARFDAALSWEDWTFLDYGLPRGNAELRGTINRYDIDYDATVTTPDALELQISGSGRGDLKQLEVFTAQVQSDIAAAELAGTVSWLPSFSARAETRVSGLRDGATITGQGVIDLAPQFIRCTTCVLAVGSNRLDVDGEMTDGELDWSVSVDAPEMSALHPDIAGRVYGEGRLRGTMEQPRFTGKVQAERLAFRSWFAQSVAIDSQDSSLDAVNIRARVSELHSGDTDYGTFDVSGAGNAGNMQLEVDWAIHGLSIDAAGILQLDGRVLAGRIRRATINEPNTGDWQLQDAFAFRLTDSAMSIEPHVWSGGSGHLQLVRLETSDEEIGIVADIERIPLSLADSFLPADFRLLGLASASIDIARHADGWSGTLQWRQLNTVLRVVEDHGRTTDIRVPRAELRANFLDGGVVAQASVSIEPGVTTDVDLQLSRLDADAEIQAELRLGGDDWSWITAVIPDIDGFQGSIAASVNANGPLLAPQLSGDIVWREGRLVLPALNVPLDNIELVISGAPQGTATVEGSAKAGGGTLAVTGNIERLMQATRSITLELSGKSAEIFNWPEYHVWGSPDLTIVGDAQGWQVGGRLTVPRADIEIREIPVEATTVSADIVVLGDEEIRVEPTRVAGEVRLVLGKQVRVKALGLDSGLSGELQVQLRQDRAISAEGRISLVKGSFETQGQQLTIQKGELTFTGPLDNPIVDVRAVRVIENFDGTVTAGIHLHGRAQNLTSTVFSEPTMNEVDALSYLVIGRPLSQATEAEGGELSGAAVSLGLRQATRLTEQIGLSVGLDQLSLSGDGGDATTLIAGKKINSRLYARYAYGIFSRLGTLLMRYRLSEHITLEAGAGEAQSIDVLYSVEKP
jgi:translocation and assembly module TamB